jgi:hypothetical protein
MKLSHPLSEDGIVGYYDFARKYEALLEDNLGTINITRFYSEARVHLDGYINKQNV